MKISRPRRIILENFICLKDLYQLADGFNIEGGNLEICTTKNQRWMNICMPLNFPFETNKTLEQITLSPKEQVIPELEIPSITQNNPYSLKEMSIDEYNECDVNLFLMLVIEYFRLEGESLLIQVHQGKSVRIFIEKLSEMLLSHYDDSIEIVFMEENLPIFRFDNGFILKLITGYEPNTIKTHPEFKNLCSLSLMGRLNPDLIPGCITLPSSFVPFNVDTNIIDFSREYLVHNYLIDILDKVLSLRQENLFSLINNYPSENLKKNHKARRICSSDIRADNVRLLQINRLYNPSAEDYNTVVKIITDE